MNQLIPVNITIADRNYRIKVEPADEEPVRKTVKFINDKVMEFKVSIAGKDMQDYVSMALIWFATQPANSISATLVTEDIKEGFTKIEGLVDRLLGQEEASPEPVAG